jgi:hypothetical protein
MLKTARLKAEEQFAATQRKAKKALNEKEKARQELTERMAKQRSLRLAKEADKNKTPSRFASALPNANLKGRNGPVR